MDDARWLRVIEAGFVAEVMAIPEQWLSGAGMTREAVAWRVGAAVR